MLLAALAGDFANVLQCPISHTDLVSKHGMSGSEHQETGEVMKETNHK